mgnify:CR=1 FL=1
MLEPLDCYRLARHLRDQGEPVSNIKDVLAQYAPASWLSDSFPQMYPFSVAPGERGRDFCYFLSTDKHHHFADGMITVKNWLLETFVRETKEVLKANYDALPVLGRNIQAMGVEKFKGQLFRFLYYRYYNYDLDQPFLIQFRSNLEQLRKLTGGGDV